MATAGALVLGFVFMGSRRRGERKRGVKGESLVRPCHQR